MKVSAGDRQEDSAHAALLTLQAELRTLEKHAGANEKISQQRRDLWKAESQFAVLEEAAQRRQLSVQEKSCWRIKMRRWSTNASWLHLATRLRIRSA